MNKQGRSGGRRGLWAPAATAALVILLVLLVGGFALVSALGSNNATSAATPSASSTSPSEQIGLGTRSPADRLVIRALGLKIPLVDLGNGTGGTMQLPPAKGAGWYDRSVAPGQAGVSVVAGYIRRSSAVPGVFANLRRLGVGDRIEVHRKDGATAIFEVSKIKAYAEGDFPGASFYQGDGTPQLRIVTTGGRLTPTTPQGNVIVDARLVNVR